MLKIEHAVRDRIGLDAASIGSTLLQRSIRLRMKSHGLKKADDYFDLLQSSIAEWSELVESVVVTETWFFRDTESFITLLRLVQESLLANPMGKARLLSLPCSSGEEPFSIAMALLDAGVAPERFEIDAMDISARALACANKGIYGKNSFRGKDLGFRNRHFQSTREGFVISPLIRKCVRFSQGNVLAENFRPPMDYYDFLFCRNLLIYFDRPTQQKALGTIARLLSPDGVIFVGPAEQPLVLEHGFVSAHIPMAFACRRAPVGAPRIVHRPRFEKTPKPGLVTPAARFNGDSPSHPLLEKVAAPSASPAVDGTQALERARHLADTGRLADAAKICEAHLRENGPSVQAYYLMGLLRDATGDATARDYYRKALYLDPNHYESLLQLALWSEKNGESADARRLKKRAQRVNPNT